MQWLVLSWALTCGYLPSSQSAVVFPGTHANVYSIDYRDTFSTKFEVSAEALNHLRIWGSAETRENISANIGLGFFSPYQAYYIGGISLYAKGIEIGISHECDHGISSDVLASPWLGGGSTEIFVKISGKTSF
jgi:hypothetical protein